MDTNRGPSPQPARYAGLSQISPPATDTSAPETPMPIPPRSHLDYAHRELPKPRLPSTNPGPPLRYRSAPFWLAVVYLITLIVPWVLICVLDKQHLTSSSYYDQKTGVSKAGYSTFKGIVVFINVLQAVSGVIVVPVVGWRNRLLGQKRDVHH
ncbi:hypothetical protein IMZ48_31435 [Candidatus Bathyarchaeota archaeon]|nr:hypothetical protein [Candidatus Bathyarchaeota archaeon]